MVNSVEQAPKKEENNQMYGSLFLPDNIPLIVDFSKTEEDYTPSEIDFPLQIEQTEQVVVESAPERINQNLATKQYATPSFKQHIAQQVSLLDETDATLDSKAYAPEVTEKVKTQVKSVNPLEQLSNYDDSQQNSQISDFIGGYSQTAIRVEQFEDLSSQLVAANVQTEQTKEQTVKLTLSTEQPVVTGLVTDSALIKRLAVYAQELAAKKEQLQQELAQVSKQTEVAKQDSLEELSISESAQHESAADKVKNAAKAANINVRTSKLASSIDCQQVEVDYQALQAQQEADPTVVDHGTYKTKEYTDYQGNKRQVKLSEHYPEYMYDVEDLFKDAPVVLESENLSKDFKIRKGLFSSKTLQAVKNVNFTLRQGETLSIVGESGSGKSTLAKLMVGIENPTAGKIKFKGEEVNYKNRKQRRAMRKEIQVVFQNPHASLNPRKTIYKILEEPLIYNTDLNAEQRRETIEKIMSLVELDKEHLNRYPHMFSGGQKQRIAIARGLILNPSVVVADEAVSALDVSVQAQILNLMLEIQKRYNTSFLFISHDLSVVRHISHRVLVMYHGDIVEYGTVEEIFNNPQHPYTKQLLAAIPKLPPCVVQKHS
ncbi:ABC transporter ATP-binding protein [Psittacicella hinzii]|uniref:ABC transporter domain-containing protein n=1 Tax=Psittacicella hinzii TaxID=2028575 RepID=A0A3A1YBT3_9GAMM|nr:ATP-binding cassette domain-containing protein [Psittacicella hinzii]RIY34630.1 hypothetical protein CKF58_07995 [Psittacicella hinzii]